MYRSAHGPITLDQHRHAMGAARRWHLRARLLSLYWVPFPQFSGAGQPAGGRS